MIKEAHQAGVEKALAELNMNSSFEKEAFIGAAIRGLYGAAKWGLRNAGIAGQRSTYFANKGIVRKGVHHGFPGAKSLGGPMPTRGGWWDRKSALGKAGTAGGLATGGALGGAGYLADRAQTASKKYNLNPARSPNPPESRRDQLMQGRDPWNFRG